MKQRPFPYYAISLLFFSQGVFANPESPQIVRQEVYIHQEGPNCTIVAQDKSIIHWKSFSIAPQETTHFTLPGSQAAVLNRVTGDEMSRILGKLSSNGSVYLLNPNGILIGKEGVIQVGSLIGSTLDVSDEHFLEGRELFFKGSSLRTIDNQGRIEAASGDVILLAYAIKNAGEIDAQKGVLALGAGQELVYYPHGDAKIQVQISSGAKTEETGILQQGSMRAQDIELKAAGNLYAYAIKNEGIIEAQFSEEHDGHVYLLAEQGHVNHSGFIRGGKAHLLGEFVTVTGEGKIDVSGEKRGGEVLLGGDYQGQNPAIMHAKATLVEKGVHIAADALHEGNGGKVIAWSDEATGFYGTASARGGAERGDGGFVEVSSLDVFDFQGLVDTSAPHGLTGTLLLDPTDITISSAADDAGLVFGGACGVNTYCFPPPSVAPTRNIQNTTITGQLATTNVTVASALGGTAGTNGDITISAGSVFSWSGVNTNTLTLNARRDININENFTNTTSAGNVTFMAGTGTLGILRIAVGKTVNCTSTGTLTFNANTTSGSDITFSGSVVKSNGDLTIQLLDDFLMDTTGSITFNAPGKTFTLNNSGGGTGASAAFNGSVTVTSGAVNWTTGGPIVFQTATGNLSIAGTQNAVITAGTTFGTASPATITHSSSGSLTVNSTGNNAITLGGAVTNAVGAGDITFNAGAGLTLNGLANNSLTANATLKAGVTNVGILNLASGTISHASAGTLFLDATSATLSNDIILTGNVDVTNGILRIDLNDDFTTNGTLNYSSPGNTMTFNSSGGATSVALLNGLVTINGNSTWTPSGTLTFNGGLTTTGAGTMTVTSGGTITAGAGVGTDVNYNSTGDLNWSTTLANSDIVINRGFSATAANVTFKPDDDFTLTATTGFLNYSAAGKTLFFNTGTSTSQNFNGAINVTGGNLSAIVVDDIIIGAGGSIVYNVPGGTCSFTSTGGVDPDFTINGLLQVDNGALSITTMDDIIIGATGSLVYNSNSDVMLSASGSIGDITINGMFSNNAGADFSIVATNSITSSAASIFNWNSTGDLTMSITGGPSATVLDISLSGTMNVTNGNVVMHPVDDLLFNAASMMNWSSPGTLTMAPTDPTTSSVVNMNGTINFTNGTMNVLSYGSITNGGTLNYSAPNTLTMTSSLANITFTGPANLNTAASCVLTCPGNLTVNNLVRNAGVGPMTANVGGNCFIGTPTSIVSSQFGSAGGLTHMTIGNDLTLQASETDTGLMANIGYEFGGQASDILLDITRNCSIFSGNTSSAGIKSSRELTMHIGGNLLFQGENIPGDIGVASIEAKGNLYIDPINVSLLSIEGGPSVLITTSSGDLTLIALDDISLVGNSTISNTGPGKMTLVCDQQAPFPPAIGSGRFSKDSVSQITTAGGELGIFTARPSQNMIGGLINGATLAQANQVSDTYYSTFTGSSLPPYTIYYKSAFEPPSPCPCPTCPTVVCVTCCGSFTQQARCFNPLLALVAFDSAEMTQLYLKRTMGWSWSCPYSVCHQTEMTDSCEIDKSGCREHPLYRRKPFEYPIYLDPCCFARDYVY